MGQNQVSYTAASVQIQYFLTVSSGKLAFNYLTIVTQGILKERY